MKDKNTNSFQEAWLNENVPYTYTFLRWKSKFIKSS